MADTIIKPRALRALLDAVLRTDSDLNAFCLDYFTDTYRQFAAGMDRNTKYNLLMSVGDASEILEHLRDAHPRQVAKHIHLLTDAKPQDVTGNGTSEQPRVLTEQPKRRSDRHDLFDALCKLLPAQFESLLFRLNVPLALTPSGQAAQATRAADLVRLLEQEGQPGLDRLTTAIRQVAPLVLP